MIIEAPASFLLNQEEVKLDETNVKKLTMLGKTPYDNLTYHEYNVLNHLPEGISAANIFLHKIRCETAVEIRSV